jgi:predicted transcriptional regulator
MTTLADRVLERLAGSPSTMADLAQELHVSVPTLHNAILQLWKSGKVDRTKSGKPGHVPRYEWHLVEDGPSL